MSKKDPGTKLAKNLRQAMQLGMQPATSSALADDMSIPSSTGFTDAQPESPTQITVEKSPAAVRGPARVPSSLLQVWPD